MPDLLKNVYNYNSLQKLAHTIQSAYPQFQADEFLQTTMDETWDKLELKARVRKISTSLAAYLPEDYSRALAILDKAAAVFTNGFFGIFFPDFIEVFGQDEENWDLSMSALERYTQYSTSEFAVRPFIISHEERMMAQMYAWSGHENEHVRRLSSEGCRPLLPWGQALVKYKKDPLPVLPILKRLKADPSLYVRKSVANNLNDISKTHPDLVISLAKEWYGKNEYTDWIVKHGCRTLLKKGNREILALFGYHDSASIKVDGFTLEPAAVPMGEDITFSFSISTEEAAKVRLEYAVDYMKANGKRSSKVFQISEITLGRNEKKSCTKKHSFAEMTTRKHYPGVHTITLIVNGAKRERQDFELTVGPGRTR
ncbi:DNA alkylation repair protein [[Clostridium] hylemonae]|uniref:DNA alkylation repair protein n=1 Tax=[Clostridium] hylemonae TaxID=89153 RepID=UPI001FCA6047|nr:DNA alkylation repair protein [[Clostridium] hylemonae]BDF03281.1 hypothetical protein CE91St63_03430 [[Clostridium] hylemonae]